MESDTENRRAKNLHTIEELEQDGNQFVSLKATSGILLMKRGSTITVYNKVEDKYWKPVEAFVR